MKTGQRSLIGIVVITAGLLLWTILAGNTPLLGLDLRGGVEVVLQPADDPFNLTQADNADNVERAAEIIRRRVDAIGVAEPDITVQEMNVAGQDVFGIIAQMPGIEDQQRAIELVGQTAELRFRPQIYPPIPISQFEAARALYLDGYGDSSGSSGTAIGGEGTIVVESDGATVTGTVDDGDVGDGDVGVDGDDGEDESGLGLLTPGDESASAMQPATLQDDAVTTEGDPATIDLSDFVAPQEPAAATGQNPNSRVLFRVAGVNGGPGTDEMFGGSLDTVLTTAEGDLEDRSVILTDDQNVYLLGPTEFTGAALDGAEAETSGPGGWTIAVDFKDGAEGIDLLNATALSCYGVLETCPVGQLATVIDRNVDSSFGFSSPVFQSDIVQISRGSFGFPEEEAKDTALVLDFGALPIEFQDPAAAGLVSSVSSTLGNNSLNAGLIAGAIGVLLVALYMIWYYRLLGVAAILSLLISASLLYVVVSYLSSSRGLALTLAGIVGLIVSIGVSLDSNVVYFEHLKEQISNGRTLRTATDKAFPIAFRTVFYANLATLIGAIILYLVTVGSVKGFALMLGIASVLDLIATYFFMRPFVHWLANRENAEDNIGSFGVGLAGRKA